MITPILEKLLFTGGAKNKTFTMAYGSYAHLDIPDNSFIVIHKIIFYPFLNPRKYNPRELGFPVQTWKDFLNDCEYQLKIQSDKENPFLYQFRNGVNVQFIKNNFNLDENIDPDQFNKYTILTPKEPIILDTFITSYDYFNFTLTRNAGQINNVNYNTVNEYANEDPLPIGIANQPVLLSADLSATFQVTNYNPPTPKEVNGYILPGANTVNYQHLYEPSSPGNFGSFIANPDWSAFPFSDKTTNPLITFEYCQIQLNKAGELSSL